MKKTDEKEEIYLQLNLAPGLGATMNVGSDSYPYYVSDVLPNGVIGLYSPGSHFEHDWVDGYKKVDAFDSKHPTEIFIKKAYRKWWVVDQSGKKRIRRFTSRYQSLHFGTATSYRDPNF